MLQNRGGPTAAGYLRIAGRLIALAVLLLVCVGGHWLTGARRNPSPWPRRFLDRAARIAGADVHVAGSLAPAPLLMLANHVSWLDILVLAGVSGSAFVAHDGLAQQPLLRWLCRLNRTVFIARERRGSVADQTVQLREALASGEVLTLFPEGTTGDGVTLASFRSSLLAAVDPVPRETSVQPVLIDYGAAAPAIAWTDGEPGLANFLRVLARAQRVPVTVRFLPPLVGEELGGRKAMAAAAHRRIVEAATSV